MKHLKKLFITFLVSILIINVAVPAQNVSAATKYGVILGNKAYEYKLYNNLTVKSPTGNTMLKAYNLSKALGLTYSYNSTTKKITIKNPVTGKYLVFALGSSTFTYFDGKSTQGASKTAAYKCYYDSTAKTNVIHSATLKYIVNYNYDNNVSDQYYGELGYQAILVYSIYGYSSSDLPITTEVLQYKNAKIYTSAEELLDTIRLNMISRVSTFTLNTNRAVMNSIGTSTSIMDTVLALDSNDTFRDADYLSLLINNIKQSWHSSSTVYTYPNGSQEVVKSNDDPASITVDVNYETDMVQERIVDNRITEIIKALKLTNASDYDKVKKIHDYVINLASYDTSYVKSSAYDLLINKTAVCEGYSLVAYRLFTEAGLESRIITGLGKGESHAWNIVKVDGQWYNIDLTWDDPISSSGKPILSYDYFLKSDADFTYHQRNAEYTSPDFLAAYSVAQNSYN